MTHVILERKLAEIPAEYLDEVSNYLDFIQYKASAKKKADGKYRKPGGLKGGLWMSDDFDAPLDDFKEYM